MNGTVELPGSFRSEPDARIVRDVEAGDAISATLHLKVKAAGFNWRETAAIASRFAIQHGIGVREDLARSCIYVDGAHECMSRAFGIRLRIYDDGFRRFRARAGSLRIPEELAPWTLAVLGFDRRPVVPRLGLTNSAAPADGNGIWPIDIARLYGTDPQLDAPGQCVGIIALGGGYLPSDVEAPANATGRPKALDLVDCPVNGVNNWFGGGFGPDREIALDLQVVAGLVPSARIAVYFTSNDGEGVAAAIRQAVADKVNHPKVLSISWGSPEKFWTAPTRNAVESALADAAQLGITVVAASGDFLATGGVTDGTAHVYYPASSPLVLGCGGTQIKLDPAGEAVQDEAAWNEISVGTGGGISDVFGIPNYQKNAGIPVSVNQGRAGRGVPDISGAASGTPGYRIVIAGAPVNMTGTSGATPLWAALIAAANSKRGVPLGLLHAGLYAATPVCRQITEGNNRVGGIGYDARAGWNACSGLGVPTAATVDSLTSIPIIPTPTTEVLHVT